MLFRESRVRLFSHAFCPAAVRLLTAAGCPQEERSSRISSSHSARWRRNTGCIRRSPAGSVSICLAHRCTNSLLSGRNCKTVLLSRFVLLYVSREPERYHHCRIAAGFESGHAYAKALRTVKSCVGSTWCRFGIGDSVGFAVRVEERYRGIRAPHKIKGAVSGCVRECAEAQCKDFGMIAVAGGYNLYLCGNGGAKPRHATLFAESISEELCIQYLDRFLMYLLRQIFLLIPIHRLVRRPLFPLPFSAVAEPNTERKKWSVKREKQPSKQTAGCPSMLAQQVLYPDS